MAYVSLHNLLREHLSTDLITVVFVYVDKNYYRQFGGFREVQRRINVQKTFYLDIQDEPKPRAFLEPLDARPKYGLVWRNNIVRWQPGKLELLAMEVSGEDRSLVLPGATADVRVSPGGLYIVFFTRCKLRWVFDVILLLDWSVGKHKHFAQIVSSSLVRYESSRRGTCVVNRKTRKHHVIQNPEDDFDRICAVDEDEFVVARGANLTHYSDSGVRALGTHLCPIQWFQCRGRQVLLGAENLSCLIDLDDEKKGRVLRHCENIIKSSSNVAKTL